MSSPNKNKLETQWTTFFEIVLHPASAILLITILIIYLLYKNNSVDQLDVFYTVILAIAASVWGGIVSNRWIQVTEKQVIHARGENAVRSLNLLLSAITNIEDRISKFKTCCDEPTPNKELLKSNFEEISEGLKTLKEIGYNSIENWQDVVPEADLKSHFKKVQKLNSDLNKEKAKADELRNKLEDAELGKDAIDQLNSDLETKRAEIQRLNQELIDCQMSAPSGSTYDYYTNPSLCNCPNCGNQYNPNWTVKDQSGNDICPNCNCSVC